MKTKELYAPEDQELFERALVFPHREYLKMKTYLDRDLGEWIVLMQDAGRWLDDDSKYFVIKHI